MQHEVMDFFRVGTKTFPPYRTYMLKKLAAYLFPSKEETGARMMAYGFLIVIPALGIAFAGWERLGYWIGLGGALIAFVGLFVHFAKNWEKIFPSDK